jgi:hypothetical protein
VASEASWARREADQTGFMMSQWAFDFLVSHADEAAIQRFPHGIGNVVTSVHTRP